MKRRLSLLFGSAERGAALDEKKYSNDLKDPVFRARAETQARLLSEFHTQEQRRFSACVLPPATDGTTPLAVDVQVTGDQKVSLSRDGGVLLLESSRPFACSAHASVVKIRDIGKPLSPLAGRSKTVEGGVKMSCREKNDTLPFFLLSPLLNRHAEAKIRMWCRFRRIHFPGHRSQMSDLFM